MSDLSKRLTDRAEAFNDAGLTHGVADLLTEAAAELARLERALEREVLAKALFLWDTSENIYEPTWEGLIDASRDCWREGADAIRTHVLGDNEGKATITATNAVTGEDQRHDNEGKTT